MSESANIQELFGNAVDEGTLSQSTLNTIQVPDFGAQINAGLGIEVDDVSAEEVVIVGIMPDDSGSIDMSGNSQVVRDGHNMVLEALTNSKQADSILAFCRYLNGDILYPISPLENSVQMTPQNYNPSKGTPLYDESVTFLATMLAKYQDFRDNGVHCRTISLLITDGGDMHSRRQEASDVNKVIADMIKTEDHIVAGMGIQSGGWFDFNQVFEDMGILPQWRLTPGNSKSEVRKAFQVFSQSAVRASQGGATNFSQAAVGGFGS